MSIELNLEVKNVLLAGILLCFSKNLILVLSTIQFKKFNTIYVAKGRQYLAACPCLPQPGTPIFSFCSY